MEALVISLDFTIEDIHKIREQNYERTKDMTVAEKVAYYNNSGKEAEREIERRRALKRKIKKSHLKIKQPSCIIYLEVIGIESPIALSEE